MRDSILSRVSRRSYIDTPISAELVSLICTEVDELNRKSGLTMTFAPDAADAFSSTVKTYGMFSGVRAMIVMKGPADLENLEERIGYYGEMLVLDLTEMGLGTCWVGGTFDKKKFEIPTGEKMLCVITLGMVQTPSAKETLIRNTISRNRRPAHSRMKGYEEAPEWVREAMEAVRLAPSATNSQKPMFHYENGIVTATVHKLIFMDLIDLGIAKLHFAVEAGGIFELGKGGRFIPN